MKQYHTAAVAALIFAASACSTANPGLAEQAPAYHVVQSRRNADSTTWNSYVAKTVDRLPGFEISPAPGTGRYGGWTTSQYDATGFFRVEKVGGRWWIIDPEGYPYIHRGIAVFRPGTSDLQKATLAARYGSVNDWVRKEAELLRQYGFNGTGAWSNVDLLREEEIPLAYTVIVSPMGQYRSDHRRAYGEYEMAGWQGYRYDLAMVFDPEFDEYVERSIAPIAAYADDPWLLGYYTDNEIPWKNDALDRHLRYLGEDEPGYVAARAWLDERRGKDSSLDDVTDEDRLAFTGFYFETYMRKVTDAIRKYDRNHLYLGSRFNQEREELSNPEMFRVAGEYMDIISINHYRKWEPSQEIMANWEAWSGRPFLITEWYVKGEDSGLPNRSGAGWNVPTQRDRGYFYQNFVIELLKSKANVGWHWFTYQDNDPLDLTTDPSNRDSNKGIVDSAYDPYLPLLEEMKSVNDNTYNLIRYFDEKP
jgi:hypothetical protein